MKKKLLTALSLVVVAIVAIVGTIAYLTSEDQDVNVMTMGNVEIEQLEYERVVDEDGKWIKSEYTGYDYTADEMQEFTQNKPAYPAVYQDGTTKWDDRNGSQASSGAESHQQPWSQIGAPGSNQLFDDSVKNVIDKFVFVKNTGKTDAYYRTIIAIECPEGVDPKLIHTNINGNSRFAWETLEDYVEINGVQYFVKVATYQEVLTPGEISRPSLLQLFLDPETTNEDCAKFGDTWDVLVLSQAVQAKGFDNAATALNKAFGGTTEENLKDWFSNVRPEFKVKGNDNAALTAAIAEAPEGAAVVLTEDIDLDSTTITIDKDVVLDLNGKSVTSNARNGVFYLKNGASVKNGTIKHNGTVAGIKVWQSEAIENVDLILGGKSSANNTITGISLQEGTDTYLKSLKNVTITTTGDNKTYNGVETYNCGNTEMAIGSMENVKIDVNGTALVLSAPAGTATNCTFGGGVYGIHAHLKGTYNVSLQLVGCTVSGETGIYAHDEAGKPNPGSLTLTYDDATVISGGIAQEFEDADKVTITNK